MASDLTSQQVRALSELFDSINYERLSRTESGDRGTYTDFLEKDPDNINSYATERLRQYFTPEGLLRTPIGKPEELGAIKAMQRWGVIPPEGRMLGVEGDVINPRALSLEELVAQVESGNPMFTKPNFYTPSIQPTAVNPSLLKSLSWGDISRGASAAMSDPSLTAAVNWNSGQPLVPSQYDPRFYQKFVASQESRIKHYEALFNKLRGVGSPVDEANIWTMPYGHSDLLNNVPTTAGQAFERLSVEQNLRDSLIQQGLEREMQYQRQLEIQLKRLEDPAFNAEYEKAMQAGRDARRFIGKIPSDYSGTIGASTDEVAMNAFEAFPERQQAGILPSLNAIAAYNRVLDAEGLRKGLLKIPEFNYGAAGAFNNTPRVKGGYLGINFGPQMEAAYDAFQERAIGDLREKIDRGRLNLDVVEKYFKEPSTRPLVNQQVGGMAKNAIGALGLAAYAGGIVHDAPSTIVAAGIPFTRFSGVGPVLEAGTGEERALYNIRTYGNPNGPEEQRTPINDAYLNYIYNFGGGM